MKMDRIKVERWHAYLTDDGEIFICEYISPELVIWSSTVSENLLQTHHGYFYGDPERQTSIFLDQKFGIEQSTPHQQRSGLL